MAPSLKAGAVALLVSAGLCVDPALAFRPFDGTDAAVADPGEIEVELGPAGLLRDGPRTSVIAPAAIVNFGVARDWEVVLQGEAETVIRPRPASTGLVENGLFVKQVWREGVLQDSPGASLATEFGVLLPGVDGEPGAGASWAGIVSDRWAGLTAHLNLQMSLTRSQHADLFVGTILEGPYDWPVRPVGEIFYEREPGTAATLSGLLGAIWQVRNALAFDIGLRLARTGGHTADEIRADVTFGIPVW